MSHAADLRAAAARTPDRALADLLTVLADTAEHPSDAAIGLTGAVLHRALAVARQVRDATAQPPETVDRRDRYAEAVRSIVGYPSATMVDAVMAVANAEINEHRQEIAVYRRDSAAQYQIIAELERENALLRRLADEAQQPETEAAPVSKSAAVLSIANELTTDPYANGVCTYGEGHAPGSGCIKPNGHDGAHLVTPGDVDFDDDSICGDQYDDEACELEPGHDGAHCAGTFCWSYALTATEEPTR